MPKYLFSISYTAEGAKGVRKDGGTKRRKVASKAVESLGGKLEALYFCFGQYDAVVIADLPDAASAAALSLAVAGTGGAETDDDRAHHPGRDGQGRGQEDRLQSPGYLVA